jgi:phage shock protein A
LNSYFDVTANIARARFVRLTEAAENLKKRAANSVRLGKESEAVDLLGQRKKLTKALESIKEQIEVLDKLPAKISEVMPCSYIICKT